MPVPVIQHEVNTNKHPDQYDLSLEQGTLFQASCCTPTAFSLMAIHTLSSCLNLSVLQCAADPVPIGVGYLAQYIVKPLLGYVIAKVCNPDCIA